MMWSGQKNISFHARDAEIDPEKFKKSMHALINGDYFEKIYDVQIGRASCRERVWTWV